MLLLKVLVEGATIGHASQGVGLRASLGRFDLHRLLMNPVLGLLKSSLHLFVGFDQLADCLDDDLGRRLLSLDQRVVDPLHPGLMRVDIGGHAEGIRPQPFGDFRNSFASRLVAESDCPMLATACLTSV